LTVVGRHHPSFAQTAKHAEDGTERLHGGDRVGWRRFRQPRVFIVAFGTSVIVIVPATIHSSTSSLPHLTRGRRGGSRPTGTCWWCPGACYVPADKAPVMKFDSITVDANQMGGLPRILGSVC
jgi:hypothetical protein